VRGHGVAPDTPRGDELSPLATSKTPISEGSRAESGTLGAQNRPVDTDPARAGDAWPPTVAGFTPYYPLDLARLIKAWPTLSQDTRAEILRIVRDNTPQPQDGRETL